MTGYHGPDGYKHKPLDDRDGREDGRGVDEEISMMTAAQDEYDPLGGVEAGDY